MNNRIEIVPFVDTAIYPVEASAQGDNAFYLEYCGASGYRPAYASCLNRIREIEAGKLLPSVESGCSAAICNKVCQALTMRQEEKRNGAAIYYINRVKMRQNVRHNAAQYGIKISDIVIKNDIKKPTLTPSEPVNTFEVGSIADAINSRIAKEMKSENQQSALNSTEKPLSSHKDQSVLTVKKGMSLIDIAKAKRQQLSV
ncbi:TPA: hypothetical protein OXK24_001825 [Acinetobacter baumannii]|uniref:Uncharacterized protein n=3 Tax=Acinetobacter baumannii TaxID=470 RepID=A0AAP1FBA6_ACIBA|nr:hypothetical protein [Acinetobacter baumannii]EGT88727.1 hypothetical protein ABNIH2_19360 [Acinetobacter baumannii ABNIH2]EKP49090.1 hypothetical protein ACINNAV2_2799 [Acinetobacter baumannii Naval-2]ELW92126.1 hypothetical protein ACINNAV78_2791 [Acinetobacter baumannii Naval-78]EMT82159.1 hypothetical protein ABNIH25_18630 [Acinetobacter baumannii ABNIH25]EMT91551.1 hypothetical protein ABNIH26_02413 [Acinetobacter baumannii ABNIH26]EMT94631.1 hypothetical protein ABNIH5_00450 [Acineto